MGSASQLVCRCVLLCKTLAYAPTTQSLSASRPCTVTLQSILSRSMQPIQLFLGQAKRFLVQFLCSPLQDPSAAYGTEDLIADGGVCMQCVRSNTGSSRHSMQVGIQAAAMCIQPDKQILLCFHIECSALAFSYKGFRQLTKLHSSKDAPVHKLCPSTTS